jgi:hypothetical protein
MGTLQQTATEQEDTSTIRHHTEDFPANDEDADMATVCNMRRREENQTQSRQTTSQRMKKQPKSPTTDQSDA